ncbi:hypothetical protein ACFL0U_01465 [Pseudomonadota bacterium]
MKERKTGETIRVNQWDFEILSKILNKIGNIPDNIQETRHTQLEFVLAEMFPEPKLSRSRLGLWSRKKKKKERAQQLEKIRKIQEKKRRLVGLVDKVCRLPVEVWTDSPIIMPEQLTELLACLSFVSGEGLMQVVDILDLQYPCASSASMLPLSAQFKKEKMTIIAEYLPKLSYLSELDLSHRRIGDEGVKVLAKVLPLSNLKVLNVSDNDISNEGAIALAEAAAKSPTLEILDFGSNDSTKNLHIDEDCVEELANIIVDLKKQKRSLEIILPPRLKERLDARIKRLSDDRKPQPGNYQSALI